MDPIYPNSQTYQLIEKRGSLSDPLPVFNLAMGLLALVVTVPATILILSDPFCGRKAIDWEAAIFYTFPMVLGFVLGGAWLFLSALDGFRMRSRVRKCKQDHPSQPWMWDYSWEKTGGLGKTGEIIKYLWVPTLGATVISMIPGNHLVLTGNPNVPLYKSAIALMLVNGFCLFLVGLLGLYVYQRLRFGKSWLGFRSFPYLLGQKIQMTLFVPPGVRSLDCNLRFFCQAGSKQRKKYQMFCKSQTDIRTRGVENEKIILEWQLPDDSDMDTCLSERPARYWELEVVGEAPGINYKERFWLPVYAKPSEF